MLPQSTYTQQLRILLVYRGDLIRPGASKVDGRVPLFACVFGESEQRVNNEQTMSEHGTNTVRIPSEQRANTVRTGLNNGRTTSEHRKNRPEQQANTVRTRTQTSARGALWSGYEKP